MGIEGGTDLARGDEPMLLVGVVEPERDNGGGAQVFFGEGNGSSLHREVDGSRTSFSCVDILDLFNSLSTFSSLSIVGGEADRFLRLAVSPEEPASHESVAAMTSAFRVADRACLRGDRSSCTLLR